MSHVRSYNNSNAKIEDSPYEIHESRQGNMETEKFKRNLSRVRLNNNSNIVIENNTHEKHESSLDVMEQENSN